MSAVRPAPSATAHLEFLSGPVCVDPVFIVGAPRSGTTILGSSLAAHSALWTSAESAYLFHLFGRGRVPRSLGDARTQPTPTWIGAEEVADEEFLAYLGLGLNALYTNRSAGKRWVEQTPLNTLMINDLARMFPGAQFIHLLRDGRAVVHSMLHFLERYVESRREEMRVLIGSWTTDPAEACRAWSQYVNAAADFAAEHPERCMTARYEDLTGDFDAGFRRIFEFLGLPYEEGPARRMRGRRINSSFPAASEGDRHAGAAWPDWSPEEREVFVREAGPTMAKVGLGDEF
jgi:hypothetical protein